MPRDKTHRCPLSGDPRGHFGQEHVVRTRTALRRHVLLVHGYVIEYDQARHVDVLRQPSPDELARRRETYRRGQQHKGRQSDGSVISSDAGAGPSVEAVAQPVVENRPAAETSSVYRVKAVEALLPVDYAETKSSVSDISSFVDSDIMDDFDNDPERSGVQWFDLVPADLSSPGRAESAMTASAVVSAPVLEAAPMVRPGTSRDVPDVPFQDTAHAVWCQNQLQALADIGGAPVLQRPPTPTTVSAEAQTDYVPEHVCRKVWAFNLNAVADAVSDAYEADMTATPLTVAHKVANIISLPRADEEGWRDLMQLSYLHARMERRIAKNVFETGRMGLAIDRVSAFPAMLTSLCQRMARPHSEAEAMPRPPPDPEDVDAAGEPREHVNIDNVD